MGKLEESGLLTASEAAQLLGISPYTVYSWGQRGVIESHKLGRCVRFSRESIRRFIEENTRPAREQRGDGDDGR